MNRTFAPTRSRRTFLTEAGLVLSALWLVTGRLSASTGEMAPDGFRILRAKPGTARLRGPDQPATPIWGYDGTAPGPTLRLRRGEEARIRLVNDLPEPTAVHWHGLRIPNAMDGVPNLTFTPIAPGKSFDFRFRPPDSGTFWYHASFNSSQQVERGLAGLLIVDEPEPIDVDRDVVLVLDDWRLKPDGALDEASFGSTDDASHFGRIGEQITANGVPSLDIPVRTNERVRLRVLNAANARLMALRIEGHVATVVAIDGQPAEPFEARDARLTLAPGNRVDALFDATMQPGATSPLMLELGTARVPIARLVYEAGAPARPQPRGPVKPLPASSLPAKMDFARAMRAELPLEHAGGKAGGAGAIWSLGKTSRYDGKPAFSVKRGRTVMLALPNRTSVPHAIHLQGHHMRLLDRLDDGWKPFWLDTVVAVPNQTTRVAFVADNPGKWMLTCQILEHAAAGMAAWFEVT